VQSLFQLLLLLLRAGRASHQHLHGKQLSLRPLLLLAERRQAKAAEPSQRGPGVCRGRRVVVGGGESGNFLSKTR
jgi:hypothetical protein